MKRNWFIYGSLMGLLLIALEATQYSALLRQIHLDLFGGLVGMLFLVFGLWLGTQLVHKKRHTNGFKGEKLGLSPREIEVLELMSEGLSNQEIADRIFVSLNTVKTHTSKIYQKMGVKRRTQAIQKAKAISSPEKMTYKVQNHSKV